MCGISGIFINSGLGKDRKKDFERIISLMDGVQSRRGPDDKGLFSSENVFLGHRRLSIQDLSKAGHQPMKFEKSKQRGVNKKKEKQLWITFNGEIYNFGELRRELEIKGYKFKTRTDTEVIMALYSEYGEKSFSRLRGMFAFGLYDEAKKKIFLVKDRYGIKPLYWWSDRDKLVFASTVKALDKSGLVPIQKNPKAIISFLLFGSVSLPATTLRNVTALPAGHYLVRTLTGEQEIVRYYDSLRAFEIKKEVSMEEAIQKTREILEDLVRIHLISDAPLGIFLSGGLDSSALAALAALGRKKPITTLSIDFREEQFSERHYQDLVAKKIGSSHHRLEITEGNFFNSFREIFEAIDQPTIDGVNTFFISQAAKKAGLKVVLSGLGSDEIFAGYPSFRRAEALRRLQKLPGFLKKPLKVSSYISSNYSKLDYYLEEDILSFYLGIRGLFSRRETAKILDADLSEINNFLKEILASKLSDERLSNLSAIDLLSYLELEFYLQNQLLKDTDFMSMYHSVEVRVPYMDHILVEYLASLPSSLKINDTLNKPILAGAVQDILPQEILQRKKMGFTFPFGQWLTKLPSSHLWGHKLPIIDDYSQKFRRGKIHWSRFWALYLLEKLY